MPILYIIVDGISPTLSTASNYLLTNMANWSSDDIAINNLIFGILYTIFMTYLVNKVKGIKFEYLMLLGGITQVFNIMSNFVIIKAGVVPFKWMFLQQIFQQFMQQFAMDMPQMATIGRVSLYLPEGFESTGVTLVIAIANVGLTGCNILNSKELSGWRAEAGYYERLFWPVVLDTVYAVFVVLITPFFVMFRAQERKAKVDLKRSFRSHSAVHDSYLAAG